MDFNYMKGLHRDNISTGQTFHLFFRNILQKNTFGLKWTALTDEDIFPVNPENLEFFMLLTNSLTLPLKKPNNLSVSWPHQKHLHF